MHAAARDVADEVAGAAIAGEAEVVENISGEQMETIYLEEDMVS